VRADIHIPPPAIAACMGVCMKTESLQEKELD